MYVTLSKKQGTAMSATVKVRRTRPRGEVRRSQILDAAAQVFLENGYAGATIDLVIERAGASKATVYSFFGGKDGLFAAIVEERCERKVSNQWRDAWTPTKRKQRTSKTTLLRRRKSRSSTR